MAETLDQIEATLASHRRGRVQRERRTRQVEQLLGDQKRAIAALKDILDAGERAMMGFPIEAEEWYARRDFARIVLHNAIPLSSTGGDKGEEGSGVHRITDLAEGHSCPGGTGGAVSVPKPTAGAGA